MPNRITIQYKNNNHLLVHRAFIISDKEHLQTELNLALQKNRYEKDNQNNQ